MRGLLELAKLASTGHGVRVAVIDSGVHATHPHVQGVAGGIAIDRDGVEHPDYTDRLGHGTAVTAAIREKAPDAELLSVKVFDRELATTAVALVRAIEWAARQRAQLINLSLGTTTQTYEPRFIEAIACARAAGAYVVAAAPQPGARWLPGALAEVVSVELDWTIARDACEVDSAVTGVRVKASGFPRPIPGVSPERNLKGPSFAVANTTGLLARLLSQFARTAGDDDHLARALAGALLGANGTAPSS
jgi:hypothetical protein